MSTDDTALLARAAHALRPGAERAELRAALEAMAARLERLVQVHDDTAAERAALRRVAAAAAPFAKMARTLAMVPDDWMLISWDAGALVVTAADFRALAAALAALEAQP